MCALPLPIQFRIRRTSTAYSELLGSYETIASVKATILKGMFILIPAMAIAGGSEMSLGGKRVDAKAVAKNRRMPFIAVNGLLVLVPAAFYLESKASSGVFDTSFYMVQVLELIAGATNLVLMGLNIRDGLMMTGRIGEQEPMTDALPKRQSIEERDGGPLVARGNYAPFRSRWQGSRIQTSDCIVSVWSIKNKALL
jgi:hypothetical protein